MCIVAFHAGVGKAGTDRMRTVRSRKQDVLESDTGIFFFLRKGGFGLPEGKKGTRCVSWRPGCDACSCLWYRDGWLVGAEDSQGSEMNPARHTCIGIGTGRCGDRPLRLLPARPGPLCQIASCDALRGPT